MPRECPVLEVLEYSDGDIYATDILSPERHLGPVKATLRRLCYSVREAGPGELDGSNDESGQDDAVSDVKRIIQHSDWLMVESDISGLPLASFSVLEALELEQLIFCGLCFRSSSRSGRYALAVSDDFLARLPPSIRRLRLGAVFHWPTIYHDLSALANQPS
ncbi:hypothetical protein MFIFM68171_02097 [Madurella fahalii]|uniref:Uncharacterized protein n=1 Tax=Madurella fahalii TaxID=1157608 RepID=A0ABQ0G295_9PEZI